MTDFVFVHSGFRTGSSWLRDKFRASRDTLVFGEVFHEMLATLDAETATSLAAGSWNSRHPQAAPYFLEFAPILQPEGGVAGYSEEMAFERYFPKAGRLSDGERDYIELLLAHCRAAGKIPVFSCTRTLGRMKQLKDAFGGKHILLTRDPFQQWCSYTEQAANGNPYFLRTNEQILNSAVDADWLDLGKSATAADFLSLQAMHKHLVLHLKLYSEIAAEADVIVNYERLDSHEYRDEIRELVLAESGLDLDLSDFRPSTQFSLVEPSSRRLVDENLMPFLPSNDRMHPEVIRLYDAMQSSMRSYAREAGELVAFTRRNLGELAQANEQLESISAQRDAAAAELERAIAVRESLADELTTERSRSAELELRLTALGTEAGDAREAAAEASRQAIEAHRREADAAQHHAMQIQLLIGEHGKAQDELRRKLTRTIEQLREQLHESGASGSAARTELARMEERTANLECKVVTLTDELRSSQKAAVDWSREVEEQRARLTATLATLARADALIATAREEQAGRWRLLGQALGLSRSPQSWRALLSWRLPAASAAEASLRQESLIDGKEQRMNSPGSTESRNPYLRSDSLAELLSWEDVDFVRCAYVTVLGRQPDRMGEAHFTNRVRMGDSKYAILWQLRRSDEARYHDPGIAGFDRALKREALRRNRLFGWLIRAALPGEGTSRQDRRFRQLRNMLAVIGSQQSNQSDTTAAIRTVGTELSVGLEKIAASLEQLSERVVMSNSPQNGGQPAEELGAAANAPQVTEPARVTDDLDLSSRERAVLWSLQSARY